MAAFAIYVCSGPRGPIARVKILCPNSSYAIAHNHHCKRKHSSNTGHADRPAAERGFFAHFTHASERPA
eukprot:5246003-Lingulodinium_polyedra.AAC.1